LETEAGGGCWQWLRIPSVGVLGRALEVCPEKPSLVDSAEARGPRARTSLARIVDAKARKEQLGDEKARPKEEVLAGSVFQQHAQARLGFGMALALFSRSRAVNAVSLFTRSIIVKDHFQDSESMALSRQVIIGVVN